jgi:hypothetical protein
LKSFVDYRPVYVIHPSETLAKDCAREIAGRVRARFGVV